MIEKPKKERRFLKTLGRVGEILIQEVLIKIGSNLIKKIVGKKTLPSILFLLASLSLFAQYPNTGNKQRLGFQTTGDGLTWRGSISDTASIQPINNQNAWVILDTVNLKIYSFDFTSNVWNLVGGVGSFTQPVDSLFFNVNVATNNVDTAKMRWDSDLATVVLGLNDNVPNELGFKNFWLVKNQTGSTITKGSIVYANGTVGASGRITVAKFIANGSIDAKYLLGITAHDLTDGEDGYVISFGKIRQVNTDTFAAGAILYPSPTVAGVWTDVEPVAPNIDMPIGFCINSSSNNGTIAIRVASGYDLSELHDVAISSPVENSSLYYKGGLWRDTTEALLVSDTAAMLANYATKAYADTTGRFYARQDFTNVSSSTLTWTQSDTLIPAGVNVVQVYRNGQILLPSQYTIPTSTSVVIAATSYKVGENYTVIFPRGGGAGSGGGSGSLTSISGGTGILVSPDPITTTGTVSADLSVLMELTDTSLLNLTSRLATKLNISDTTAMLSNYNTRINSKLNISDTLSMLAPYFRDADTSSLNLTSRFALKLNATDTASLSSRIDAKGTGTVTSIATGYGLSGGTIASTGTLVLDSAVVFSRIRDSIVDVAIGNDTIKILKQEYNSATTNVLTWTVTPKFPIQLKAYILVFRNGQLLINDQYNLTDTNKITIVSNSFKVGANYTVVTVSGIGSVGTGTFPNPVYPEAGIAVSTGTTWTTSIPNNSSNWNIAFNDKITNAAFSGTNTKTLTLTQYDGGTFTPTFTDLQGIVAADTASMLTPYLRKADTSLLNLTSRFGTKLNISDTASMLTNYLRSGVAASTYQTILSNPVTGTGTTNTLPLFTGSSTLGNSVIQESSGNIGIGTTPIANLTFDVSKNILLKSGSTGIASILFSETGTPSSTDVEFGGILRYNGSLDRMELVTRDNLGGSNVTNTGVTMDRISGNIGLLKPTTVSSTLAVTGNITEGGNNVLTNLDTASLSSRIDLKLSKTDTASLSSRIDGKVSLTATESISGTKTFNNLVNIGNQMTISGSVSGGNILLGKNTSNNGVADITLGTGLSISSNVLNATLIDTTSLSNRINLKYDKTGGTISGAVTLSTTSATPSSLLGKDGSNVVGAVTTVAQTGLFGRGSVTNAVTDANGIITVAHGFSFTPIMAFANLPASTTNIVNVKEVDGTNIVFVVRDGATNNVLNTQSVTKIEFFAIK
jgi:hypothetical protein